MKQFKNILLLYGLFLLRPLAIAQVTTFYENSHEIQHYREPEQFHFDFDHVSKDKDGHLWLLNMQSLVRYDGVDFQVFRVQGDSRLFNAGRQFGRSKKDSKGNIWLSSKGGGVAKFEPNTGRFVRQRINPTTIADGVGYRIAEDQFGGIWVGYDLGILKVSERDSISTELIRIPSVSSELKGIVDSLLTKDALVESLTQVRNDAFLSRSFEVEEDRPHLIVAQGELKIKGWELYTTLDEFADFGWITDEAGDTVWQMDARKSLTAGRIQLNRIVVDHTVLPAGRYVLHYRTNDDFAFDDWSFSLNFENDCSPTIPEWWGIQVFESSEEIAAAVRNIKSNYERKNSFKLDYAEIYQDSIGEIWVYGPSLQKLVVHSPDDYHFEDYLIWGFDENSSPMESVAAVHRKDGDHLWVSGTDKAGNHVIGYLNIHTRKFKQIKTGLPGRKARAHERSDVYDTMLSDAEGNLWLGGHFASGLHKLSPPFVEKESEKQPAITSFYFMNRVLGQRNPYPLHGIKALEFDDFNNLWVATWRDYLLKINLDPAPVTFIDLKETGISEDLYLNLMYDPGRETYWISKGWEEGLVEYRVVDGSFQSYREEFKGHKFQRMNPVQVLANGKLLFFYMQLPNRFFLLYDPDTDTAEILSKADPRAYSNARESFMYNDSLLSTDYFGKLVNINTGQIVVDYGNYLHSLMGWNGRATRSKDGNLWIAGSLSQLGKFAFNGHGLDTLELIDLYDHGLPYIIEDRKDNIWLSGFDLLSDLQGGVFQKQYTEQNGLQFYGQGKIVMDDRDRVWLFPNSGISVFDPAIGQAVRPQQLAHIHPKTVLENGDGTLSILGKDNEGIYVFHPGNLQIDPAPPKVTFKSITAAGKNRTDTADLSWSDTYPQLRFPYQQRNINISYSGIQFNNPTGITFAYKLDKAGAEWQMVGKERLARFLNLSPGSYTFSLKAANADGVWSQPKSFQFIIRPPWWWSWWTKAIYGLLAGLLIWRYIHSLQEKVLQREAQLQQEQEVNERLRKTDKLKDEFLANTSHELRTPLNGIIGIADSLIDGAAGPQTKKGVYNLGLISSSGRRLSNLVNDILDFSKLRNRDLQLRLSPVDLYASVDVILNLSKTLMHGKAIELVNAVPSDMGMAKADENRLQQILHNLVANAIKFTESGSVVVGAREEGRWLSVHVADTGIGIAEGDLEKIFRSFEQGDGSTAREYGGTGLGLAITKKLVELHGGEIRVESTLGQGSTFTFSLPLMDADHLEESPVAANFSSLRIPKLLLDAPGSQEAQVVTPVPIAGTEGNSHFRILIVDDEPVNLQVLENHLSLYNYTVKQALSGHQALEIVREESPFDMIILDIMMPKMSGYEVCERLRELYPAQELPVVMLTAKNRVTDLVEGFSSGANDYLTKPFSKDELLTRIKTHLELSQINRAYGRFVPHDFLKLIGKESIIDTRLGDQAAGKMTVLFSDIRSYTSLSEQMTPTENFEFINAYLEQMGPIVDKNAGFVTHFLGDGIMALFKRSPADALRAAIAMQQQIYEFNRSRKKLSAVPIRIGIGIHSGELMVGIIGDEKRNDTGVISDAVNTASRIEGLTKVFNASILLSGNSLSSIPSDQKTQFNFRYLGKVQVKGKLREIGVFECIDGDHPEMFRLKQMTKKDFESALEEYLQRDFAAATSLFKKVLAINPADASADFYLEQSTRLMVGRVEHTWTGVIQLDQK